ncbi:hypothetical protein GCM10025868_07630 [Angustibacter aerolatus]|uniref:Extracellular solute-binding protein n=1 Tax=Angustibacter aerolatus TaxID=1162965 RepID=A0ABQ6JBF8_9ACTN|nr:hypothetical protein [Angustibacter aerolatus]GMA85513.1 hypothetical protein GCM10025868_07630 [Angustibacter aerolatus]
MAARTSRSQKAIILSAVAGISLALGACGGGDDSSSTAGGGAKADCAKYTSYGDLKGKSVSVYTSIVTPEDQQQIDSYKPFEDCTGAKIKYEGNKDFEAQLPVRVKGGNAPDIAYIPQPGLLKTLVATGKVVKAPDTVSANVDKWWGKDWKSLRHRRRHLLRRAPGCEREVVRLVLAEGVRGQGLQGPRDVRRAHAGSARRSPPTTPTPSRGARASAPATRPAGRPPTGSRTCCCAPRAPTSTTSGSTTRSRSTTRRWPTRWPRSAAS